MFTKLYVPVVIVSTRHNQRLSKLINKGLESSVNWHEYKRKSDHENATNKFIFFPESNFVGVNKLFVLVYTNQDTAYKRFQAKRYQLLKGFMDSYNVTINGKNFYDQADIKRYEEIRKLTTGQYEDYTT